MMKPNNLLLTLCGALLLTACGQQAVAHREVSPRDTVTVPEGYTSEDSIAYIEDATVRSPITAQDLLGLARVHEVEEMMTRYGKEEKATRDDSVTLALANRFLRMGQLVKANGNAHDKLQWTVAVNKVINDFTRERPEVPADSALGEARLVIDKFSSMTQFEMNFQSFVDEMIDYYRTLDAYRRLIDDATAALRPLVKAEYEAWNDLNEARFAFWNDVSFNQEWYSMKPMDIEGRYERQSSERRDALAIERDILLNGKPYSQRGSTMTAREWDKWLTRHSVPDDIETLRETGQADLIPADSTVTARTAALKTAMSRWLDTRHAIAAALPQDRGQSYDRLTADMHRDMLRQ